MVTTGKAEFRKMGVGFWGRHRWLKWVVIVSTAGFVALTAVILVLAHRAEPILRARIVQELEEHFHARVELDSFHVTLRGGLWAEGKGLRVWPPAEVGGVSIPANSAAAYAPTGHPLISLKEFRFHAPLHYNPADPIHISVVQLKGLDIDLPPKSHFGHDLQAAPESEDLAQPPGAAPKQKPSGANQAFVRFDIKSLDCTQAHLTIETSKPGKLPLEFAIARLKITGLAAHSAMRFEAELTNPRPQGVIHTQGSFGPWLVSDPGESHISGDYRFDHADLSTFKGIAGFLNSTGRYDGTLRNIDVHGVTDTQDFQLTHFGTPLPLHTDFHALVDGTNGDTRLDQVEATLEHSHFWVQGQIVGVLASDTGKSGPRPGGHDIALTVNVDRGRIEDFLRLASSSGKPVLTGALTMKAALQIPPGPVPVHRRLRIRGAFVLNDAQFTSGKLQDRVGALSARGQGDPKQAKAGDEPDVRALMKGDFQMAAAAVTFSDLEYTVPGATIDVNGTYGTEGSTLNFAGTAKMEATVSQMLGGWKGFLAKPLDRYFKKDGAGTELPIRINGTRQDPHFGLDFGKAKKTSPQRPDEKE